MTRFFSNWRFLGFWYGSFVLAAWTLLVTISLLNGVKQGWSLDLAVPEIFVLCGLLTCTILVARRIRFRPADLSRADKLRNDVFVEEYKAYNETAFADLKREMIDKIEAAIIQVAEETREINDQLKKLRQSPSAARSVYFNRRSRRIGRVIGIVKNDAGKVIAVVESTGPGEAKESKSTTVYAVKPEIHSPK